MSEEELVSLWSGKRVWLHGDSLVGNVANHLQQTLLQQADARGNATLFFKHGGAPSWRSTHASRRAAFAKEGADSNAFGHWCTHSRTAGCSYKTKVGLESTTLFWPGENLSSHLRTSDLAVVNARGLWTLKEASSNKSVAHDLADLSSRLTQKVLDLLRGVCEPVRTGRPMLTMWLLTNALVDELVHVDREREVALFYDEYSRHMSALEVDLIGRYLEHRPACRKRLLVIDTYHLTRRFPQCTRGVGDGRHYVFLQAELWQLLANAYVSWVRSEARHNKVSQIRHEQHIEQHHRAEHSPF